MLVSGAVLALLAWSGVQHAAAVVAPMFFCMGALMMTLPQATAGGLTPFPDIAGSASSLMSFAQFTLASSTALAVGVTFDGTARPMATAIALAAVLAYASFRVLIMGPRTRCIGLRATARPPHCCCPPCRSH